VGETEPDDDGDEDGDEDREILNGVHGPVEASKRRSR